MAKKLSYHQYMYNLYTKFIKILEICKQFSQNLVNEAGNIPRRGPVPKFFGFRGCCVIAGSRNRKYRQRKMTV